MYHFTQLHIFYMARRSVKVIPSERQLCLPLTRRLPRLAEFDRTFKIVDAIAAEQNYMRHIQNHEAFNIFPLFLNIFYITQLPVTTVLSKQESKGKPAASSKKA